MQTAEKREEIDRRFAAIENAPKIPEDVGGLDAIPKMLVGLAVVVVVVVVVVCWRLGWPWKKIVL